MSSDVDVIHEMSAAVGARDLNAFSESLHPDVVWEHNLGVGSPEEGVYRGREGVLELFQRIVETWEYIRPQPNEVLELDDGVHLVRGDLLTRHATSPAEIVTPYEQHFEFRDGLLRHARMTIGRQSAQQESPNVARVRRFVDGFNRLDLDAAFAELDPDVELHEWPEAPGAQTFHGRDGVRQALDTWFETWQWMQVEIEDVVEAGDRVLFKLHQRAKGRGSQVEVEIRSFNVYTFSDGKVIRIQLFTEREPALEAAGLTTNYEKEKR